MKHRILNNNQCHRTEEDNISNIINYLFTFFRDKSF